MTDRVFRSQLLAEDTPEPTEPWTVVFLDTAEPMMSRDVTWDDVLLDNVGQAVVIISGKADRG